MFSQKFVGQYSSLGKAINGSADFEVDKSILGMRLQVVLVTNVSRED